MEIRFEKTGKHAVMTVSGRLDSTTAPEFECRILERIAEGESLCVLDLSELEYVSSAGLRSLLVAAKRANAAGGGLTCCGMKGLVKNVFRACGFQSIVPVCETVHDALARS